MRYKNRGEVPEKYKWDLTDFFKSDKEFNDEIINVKSMIPNINKYKGCTKDNKKLLSYLDETIKIETILEKLYIYSYLNNDVELGNSKWINNKNIIEDLMNEYNVANSFFNPELLKLNEKEYNNLFLNGDLLKYKALLDNIYRYKGHVLSSFEEEIISRLENSTNIFEDASSTMLNKEHNYGSVKIGNQKEIITPTNLRSLLKNEDVKIRRKVYQKYNNKLGEYGDTSAAFLNGYVKLNNEVSKIHNFKSAWDEKLFSLQLTEQCYDALKETVLDNVDVLQKYLDVFKDTLGLKKLHLYDMNLDIANNKTKYSIEEAQNLTLKAVKVLGKEYYELFNNIFKNRYIDYACYKGKCSGGYSFKPSELPSRILMSYNDDLESISTIIHEGGHNVHGEFLSTNNDVIYREVSTLLSEVASLTNECLLSYYLINNGSKEEQISGISNLINVVISNLFGSVREGIIEQEFNNYVLDGNTLTKEYLNKLTLDSLKKFYGNKVLLDESNSYSWMRRSHYYMNYYLFNYAFCISVALYVSKSILDNKDNMLDKYLEFLKIGSDVTPIEAFKVLGIDLEDKKVYQQAIDNFNELIDELVKRKEV